MSKSSTLRLGCQIELNKRSVVPRCDGACAFVFRQGVPSACALHGLCAMSSNMIKYDLGMLLSCFDCTKLSAQNRKFALQTSGGSPKSPEFNQGRCPTETQTKPRKPVSGNVSDGSTNKLNRESQFLATIPSFEIQTF